MEDKTASELIDLVRSAELAAPAVIRFGPGVMASMGAFLGREIPRGPVICIVDGQSAELSGIVPRVTAILQTENTTVLETIYVSGEPTVSRVDEIAAQVRERPPAWTLAVGGGSVIDTGKAVSALATNPGSVKDYLEGVGRGFTVANDPLPFVAVPTTSGTGAEMTKNAVIADHDQGFKKSMRDARMIPRIALLDPEQTRTVPAAVTAAAGMDAVTQLIEPCITAKRSPAVSELAGLALRGTREALPRCCREPDNLDARSTMALASGMSGVCLANAGLALVHGIASGLGGLHPVAHGLICGILLPHALRYNRDACKPELGEALRQFLGEDDITGDTIDRGITALERLQVETGVPRDLALLGLDEDQVRQIATASMGSSMTGNPIPMTPESTLEFLRPICGVG